MDAGGLGGDVASKENITVGHVIVGRRSRQSRTAIGVELAALKHRSGRTENKIGSPFDITILEILPAVVAVNGVLAP
jgi:hypothetical protein